MTKESILKDIEYFERTKQKEKLEKAKRALAVIEANSKPKEKK